MNSMLWQKLLLPAKCMDPMVGGERGWSWISSCLSMLNYSNLEDVTQSSFNGDEVNQKCEEVNQL